MDLQSDKRAIQVVDAAGANDRPRKAWKAPYVITSTMADAEGGANPNSEAGGAGTSQS